MATQTLLGAVTDALATEMRNDDRVIEHMTEGLRLSPNARSRALIHGLALIQTGREQEGREALAEVIEWRLGQIDAGNERSPPWLDLVFAYGELGETAEALDAFDAALRLRPALVACLSFLALRTTVSTSK